MFKDAQRGDVVYSVAYGRGVITSISDDPGATYPVNVTYDHDAEGDTYTFEGKRHTDDYAVSLFWAEVPIPKECTVRPEGMIYIDGKGYSESTIQLALRAYVG
jgi:hypothetical protein